MAEINATNPSFRSDLTQGMIKANNKAAVLQGQSGRNAEYYIYIYTVSDFDHRVEKPWLRGMDSEGNLTSKVLKGKSPKEDYAFLMAIPHPMSFPTSSVDAGIVYFTETPGMFVVNDLLNPNPTNDFAGSNNLERRGVFYSMTKPPKPEEVVAARKKMEAHFSKLLEKATIVERSNPKELETEITAEHHNAAEYFGKEYSWHQKNTRPVECPNCGESIKAGIAFHKDASGDLCILDWGRAVKAGKATREQAYAATNEDRFAPQAEPAKKETLVPAAK